MDVTEGLTGDGISGRTTATICTKAFWWVQFLVRAVKEIEISSPFTQKDSSVLRRLVMPLPFPNQLTLQTP